MPLARLTLCQNPYWILVIFGNIQHIILMVLCTLWMILSMEYYVVLAFFSSQEFNKIS